MYHMEHTHNERFAYSVSEGQVPHGAHTINALLTVSVRGMYHGRGLDNTSVVNDSASIIVVI